MSRRHEVSFIDAEVKKWLDEKAPEDGLCLGRFHADFTVEGLCSMEAGQELEIEDMKYRLTVTGKKCFSECELLRRTGDKCPLASGVAFGRSVGPSADKWLETAKSHESAPNIGMYLVHNGVVRRTAKAQVRDGIENASPVSAMEFSYDAAELEAAVAETYKMPGIYYIRTWLAEGRLEVGDSIMYVLIGGDMRPNVTAALDYLVGRIKDECVTEKEIY